MSDKPWACPYCRRDCVNETTELVEADAEIERLRAALDRDKTGLASALAEIAKLCAGYDWATLGRGPYAWDDDEYRAEFAHALESIHGVARTALLASGRLATEALGPG